MPEDTPTLFARSEAAIAETKLLVQINLNWQAVTRRNIDAAFRSCRFERVDRKTRYPQDFREPRRDCRPFPAEDPRDPLELL